MDPDTVKVISVLTGGLHAACSCECTRLKELKAQAIGKIESELAAASATIRVGDESWDFDRFFASMQKLIEWIDRRCDQLEPLGFIQSAGPECNHGRYAPWPS